MTHDLPCKSPKRAFIYQCVSTQRQIKVCRQNIARHVWRLRHTQCFTKLLCEIERRLWVAAHSRWVFSSPKSVSLLAQALLAPQSTSLVWHRLNDCRRADCQTIKRIAFHRKVTNFGLHATACNSGVPSNWHRSALQNDSHLSPTCQTLPMSQSFGR